MRELLLLLMTVFDVNYDVLNGNEAFLLLKGQEICCESDEIWFLSEVFLGNF